MKKFLIPFAAMAAFAMFSCSDTKTPAGEKAELAKAKADAERYKNSISKQNKKVGQNCPTGERG